MDTIITIKEIFYLIGAIVMFLVGMTLKDKGNPKRYTTALFWFLFGTVFLFGDLGIAFFGKPIAYRMIGIIVLLIALIAGTGQLSMGTYYQTTDKQRRESAIKLGNKIFLPAVLIPVITVLCTLFLKQVSIGGIMILDQNHLTLAALAVACIFAILVGWKLTGGNPFQAISESRRLVDSIGWAAILPMMLAMLGGVFVAAKTGQSVQEVVRLFVDPNNRFLLIVIYCVGMAMFTMIMGNAFAAFPVMTAGIALPFLIVGHHADAAPLVAIGMYSGYCGTLMTPMAANFNVVPAALLELKDKYQVIKVQIPTALAVLVANIFLMYFIVFR
jgi:uncharacterized membrane protein